MKEAKKFIIFISLFCFTLVSFNSKVGEIGEKKAAIKRNKKLQNLLNNIEDTFAFTEDINNGNVYRSNSWINYWVITDNLHSDNLNQSIKEDIIFNCDKKQIEIIE
jgi:hypothetical protein